MPRGCFIVIEGPEGAGKSTLLTAIADRMREAGIEPVTVRQPGGTRVAEALRHELLDADREWTAEQELLYVAAARADVMALVIGPALAAGRVVLCDRHDLSTHAYQGAGRGIPDERIRWLLEVATRGRHPDLTLVLDIDPLTGRQRQGMAGKGADRLEREDAAFHGRVAAAYLAASGPGVHHLDGAASPEAVLHAAWVALTTGRPDLFHPAPEPA